MFGGDGAALTRAARELDAVEADLALARGRVLHARFLETRDEDPSELALFERAAELYRGLRDTRGEGEALFWIGCFHQVVRDDFETAVPPLRRSYELATATGDKLTRSYAARHLGFAEGAAGRFDAAQELLEESLRLRRELGFMPGVGAALLALAELAKRQGNNTEARALANEAGAVAEASDAAGVLRWVERFRQELQ